MIIQQMCEAWEEILREMDSKLLKFAESKKVTKVYILWRGSLLFTISSLFYLLLLFAFQL